jgi:conjugative relaxase-like TrwC/TraI family protein
VLGLGPEVRLNIGRRLDGTLDPRSEHGELALLLEGVDPTTGQRLVPDRANRRRGFDLTFSASKSLSIPAFLHPDPRVRDVLWECHREAVAETVAMIEEDYAVSRRGHGGRDGAVRARFAAAAWDHGTSRADDPQVHTHVVIAGLAWGDDGKLGALDWTYMLGGQRGRRRQVAMYSAVCDALTRHKVAERLGADWTDPMGRDGHREITGTPPGLVNEYSQRRDEILAAAGPTASAKSLQAATLATREKKSERTAAELTPEWIERLRSAGLSRERLAASYERAWRRRPAADKAVEPAKEVVRLGAKRATWTKVDLIAHLARSPRRGVASTAELLAAVDAALAAQETVVVSAAKQPASGLLPLGETRYASRTLLSAEEGVAQRCQELAGRGPALDPALVAAVAATRGLTGEQAEALAGLLSPGFVHCLRGGGGATKTFVIGAAGEAWRAQGREVVGLALSWQAANELTAKGVESEAIAAAFSPFRDPPWRAPKGGVVVVDEASMVPTPTLAKIFEKAEKAGAQVVLVGDNRQLGTVEGAGGLFARLAEEQGTIELTANLRQTEAWEKKALAAIRAGRAAEGLTALVRHGRIAVAPDEDTALGAMVADWCDAVTAGDEAVMLSATRAGRDQLAAMGHAALVDAGLVRSGGIELAASDEHEGVAPRVIAAGDRVRFLARRDFPGGKERVVNGTEGMVVHATARQITVDLGGRVVKVPTTWATDHVAYAYAATIASSQGRTVGTAAIAKERLAELARRGSVFLWTPEALALEDAYVGLSRAADSVHLYSCVAPGEPVTGGHLLDAEGRAIDLPPASTDPLAQALRRWRETGAERSAVAELERSERVRQLAALPRAELDATRRGMAERSRWWLETTPAKKVSEDREALARGETTGDQHRRLVAAAWRESRIPPDLVELVERIDEIDAGLAERRRVEVAALALSRQAEPVVGPVPADGADRSDWWSAVGEMADAAHATGMARGNAPDEALDALVDAVGRAGSDSRSLDELVAAHGAEARLAEALDESGGGRGYRRLAAAWAGLGEDPVALTEAVAGELAQVRDAGPGLWAEAARRRLAAAVAANDDVPIAVAVAAIAPDVAVRAVLAAVAQRDRRAAEADVRETAAQERAADEVLVPVVAPAIERTDDGPGLEIGGAW